MNNLKCKKSSLFRILVACSVVATLLVFINTWKTKETSNHINEEKAAVQSRIFETETKILENVQVQGPPMQEEVVSNAVAEIPTYEDPVIANPDSALEVEVEDGQEQDAAIIEEPIDPNFLVVTHHDPDPGQELLSNNNDQPEQEVEIQLKDQPELEPQANAEQVLLSPESPDFMKVLKETSLSFQREEVLRVFSSATRELSPLLIPEGGRPMRNVIFTSWGMGSSFVGEAVAEYPATFYHDEPLINFGVVQIGPDSKLANEAIGIIKSLLHCDYSQLENPQAQERNKELFKFCKKTPDLCVDPDFLSQMCQVFPFQAMKVVRLRLKLAETLLEDDDLNMRILHLVRDPRGTLYARLDRHWCHNNPVCDDPTQICSDMVDDYHAAVKLNEKFPEKFIVLRYEDISLNLRQSFKSLLHHFRFNFHSDVQEFLDKISTKLDQRDSKITPFQWIEHFQQSNARKDELFIIQKKCKEAMSLWGYAPLNKEQLQNVHVDTAQYSTLLKPPWKDEYEQKEII